MASNRVDDLYDYNSLKAQADKVFALLDETTRRVQALNALNINFNFGGRGGAGGAGNNAAGQQADQLAAAIARLNMAQSELGQQIATVNEQTRQQSVVNRQNAQATLAENGSLNSLRATLNQLTRQYDNLSAAERNNISVGRQMVTNIQQLQREIRALESETGRMQRNVGNYPGLVGNGIKNLAGAFGVATGLGAIAATGKAIFDTTVRLDSLDASLRAVSKTDQEFAINQKFLLETSDRLGLNILDLSTAYRNFYAASTLSGLSAEETRKIFNSVAESAATLKLSTQDTQGVLLAFSQILGKGKVQAEELRGQIGERVPGAFKIAANSIGVTEAQLNKMLDTGQLIAKDFLPKFATELQKNFGAGTEPVIGLQASVNRLSNTFTKLVSDNQSGLTTFFSTLIDLATSAIKVVNNLAEAGNYLYNVFSVKGRQANKDNTLTSIFKDMEKDLADVNKTSLNSLIEQRNTVDKNIEVYENLLNSQKAGAEQAREDMKRTHTGKLVYEDYAKSIDETTASLDTLNKTRALLVAELTKRTKVPIADAESAKELTDAEKKALSRLEELRLKAALEANKITLQAAIDSQLEIINSEKFSQNERLRALATYNKLRLTLVHDNEDAERKILKENIIQKQAVAEQGNVITAKVSAEEIKITRDGQALQANIIKDGEDKEIASIVDKGERRKAALEASAIDELKRAKELHDQQLISDVQYTDLQAQIENKYQIESLNSEAEYIRQLIALRKLRGENVDSDEQKLLDIQNQINRLGLVDFSATEKEKTKIAKEEAERRAREDERIRKESIKKIKDIGQQLLQFANNMITAQYKNESDRIDENIKAISDKKDKEVKAIQDSTDSEQAKADKIAVIEARAAQQTELLEERKRQNQEKEARFEKAKAVASIIVNTAAAIAKALPVIPLALLAGALGAAQLAVALSTPVPKYKDGISYSPEGLAIVGDGGRHEVIETNRGAFLTPATDTLVNLSRGSRVHKSVDDYYRSIGGMANSRLSVSESGKLSMDGVTSEIKNMGDRITHAVKANKSVVNIRYEFGGIKVDQETMNAKITHLQKNIFA